jgi:hypothetical protein
MTPDQVPVVAASANLQIQLVQSTPKGETTVAVVVTDESGNSPITCEMVWAWTPLIRKSITTPDTPPASSNDQPSSSKQPTA